MPNDTVSVAGVFSLPILVLCFSQNLVARISVVLYLTALWLGNQLSKTENPILWGVWPPMLIGFSDITYCNCCLSVTTPEMAAFPNSSEIRPLLSRDRHRDSVYTTWTRRRYWNRVSTALTNKQDFSYLINAPIKPSNNAANNALEMERKTEQVLFPMLNCTRSPIGYRR